MQIFKDANVHSSVQSPNLVLFEEALLVFEAQDVNIERYTRVAAAVQNAIQCYCVIYDDKKKSYYPDITGSIFKEGR